MLDTKVLAPSDEALSLAVSLLSRGELVGIPTETVYGLAANAFDEEAVKKIFIAKGRPQDNPLIVHIGRKEDLAPLVKEVYPLAEKLADTFWPGPFTMILPRSEKISDVVTASLDTVAVRFPSNEIASRLIRQCQFPLAAPSGNLSGRPSPTKASHMYEDMNGRIPLILDGGSCKVGVESTVVLVERDQIRLLRPGGITAEALSKIAPVQIAKGVLEHIDDSEKALSPGMKYKHYAPKAEVLLVDGEDEAFYQYVNRQARPGDFALAYEEDIPFLTLPCLSFGSKADPLSQSQAVFSSLREGDERGAKRIFARCPKKGGMGLAIYNRLIRAAGFTLITL